MAKIINLLLTFIMLSLFIAYFFINIKELWEGSPALGLLYSAVLIGSFMVVLQILLAKKVIIRKSFFVIILFFTYFIFRIVVDTQNADMLKALTIGTNGGMILYYISGALVGFSFLNIKKTITNSKQLQNIYSILIFILVAIFSFFYFDLLVNLLSLQREDIFLISGGSNYQRVGSFMLMTFIILFHFIMLMLIDFKYKNRLTKFLYLKSIIWNFTLIISALLFSQLIGSNNAFVNLMILLIVFSIVIMLVMSKKSIFILSNYNILNIFRGEIVKRIYFHIFIAILVIALLLFLLIAIYDIDINRFRILGFGTEGATSVNTRLELWNNFFIHLDYSLLLGNMMVDTHTTGTGSYVHSFIASLLTHLGLFGFLLFFVYLFFAIKENMISYNIYYLKFFDNIVFAYSFLLFAGIFLVASASVYFSWTPIWFLFGLIFPQFILINKEKNEKNHINSPK